VVPVGAGTKTGWAAPPTSADLLLDLTALDRIVEHTAGDLVVIAQAGVRIEALAAQLAGAGQALALDPPEPGATLGGIVSANASGPRRLRYGTVRDLLIGVTVVLADGTVAHSGGKVVKNVAGYDLGKLYTGAHGSLGVVVSTTWRLHPRPAATAAVTLELPDAAAAAPLALALSRSTLTPTAVELLATVGAGGRLVVLFEAIAESVAAQATSAVALLGGGAVSDQPPAEFGQRPGGPDQLLLRLAYAPAALPAVLAALPDGATLTASACSGIGYAALPAADGVAGLAGLRAALAEHDGTAVVLRVPDALRAGLDHWGPVGDALTLMRQVKDRFDPERRLSPGRFVGGI
jgi:glycolate oxidase FAD binding subunit